MGFLPTEAGVGNGFPVYTLTDFLVSVFNIAFHHEAFDKRMDVRIKIPVLQNLPDDAAAELVRAFEGLDGFPIIFSNGEALYRPELLDDPQHFGMDAYVENFKSHCTAVPDMEQRFLAAPYPVEKLDFYFVDSAERAKYLARVQDVRAWVVPCESAGVEVNAIGVDKGSGLQALCRCLNIPISAAIAIGDSENDRPLLRDAGLPLAMGNAIADVKAAAQYVMPDCDHDGVAEAIERFLLAQS